MKEKRERILKRFLRIIEIMTDIVLLALGMQMLASLQDTNSYNILLINALLSFSCILSAVNTGKVNKSEFIKNLVLSGVYLLNAIMMIPRLFDQKVTAAAFTVYAAAMIFGRVMSIGVRHKRSYTVLNIILIVFWTFAGISTLLIDEMSDVYSMTLFAVTVPVQMLIRITRLSFAHIRYDILFKVIRKSMAPEILTGLLILIAAFSVGLYYVEPGIESYSDALWYCFAIVTTIGFGDIAAVSGLGRVMSVILGIYGIIVVSLITSVIVNFYTEVNKEPDSTGKTPPPEEKEQITAEK